MKINFIKLVTLIFPVFFAYLAKDCLFILYTIWLARIDDIQLSGFSLAATFYSTLFAIGVGLLSGLTIRASQSFGVNNFKSVTRDTQKSYVIATTLAIFFMILMNTIHYIFPYFGKNLNVIYYTSHLLYFWSFGVWPVLICLVFDMFSLSIVRPLFILMFAFIDFVVILSISYILIFGKFGFPAMGVMGISWAYVIGHYTTLALRIIYLQLSPVYRSFALFSNFNWRGIFRVYDLLRLSIPSTVVFGVNRIMVFIVLLMLVKFSADAVAAQQIVNVLLYILLIISYSFSQATTVVVGNLFAKNEYLMIKSVFLKTMLLMLVLSVSVATLFILYPKMLLRLILAQPVATLQGEMVRYFYTFFPVAVAYTCLDTLTMVVFGALRGFSDVIVPMLFIIFAAFLIHLPAAIILGFYTPLHASGVIISHLFVSIVALLLFSARLRLLLSRRQKYSTLYI